MSRPTARARAGAGGDSIRIDMGEFKEFADRLKTADKKLAAKARKRIKAAANETVEAMQAKVLEPPPPKIGGITYGKKTYTSKNGKRHSRKVVTGFLNSVSSRGPRSIGTRAELARSLTVSMTNSKKSAGVTIKADRKKVAPGISKVTGKTFDRSAMLMSYDSGKAFRHPVFADAVKQTSDQWKWVYQRSNPWFNTVFREHRDTFMARLREAMDDVLDELDN